MPEFEGKIVTAERGMINISMSNMRRGHSLTTYENSKPKN
jgi:hypothetical protein